MVPPTSNILDIINKDEKYSTLKKIIEGTEIERILKQEGQDVTFLAPDNGAFSSVSAADLKLLMEDKEKATVVLKNHILTGMVLVDSLIS